MTTVEYFEMTPSGLAHSYNLAAERTVGVLVENGEISIEKAEKFLTEYAFVAVRNTSVLQRVKSWLFKNHDKEPKYSYVLVKLNSLGEKDVA